MGLRRLNPVTPGQRHKVANDYAELTTDKPEKSLLVPLKKSGGRNNQGKMTMRYIGGGHKRKYRIIDFKRDKHNMAAEIVSVEYDPNRSAFISLVNYEDGEKRYIIAPEGIEVGQKIYSGTTATPDVGNTLPLSQIPQGTEIHNIEMQPGKGAKICRSAGSYAVLKNVEDKYCVIKLPSGETRMILSTCSATVGKVSNSDHFNVVSGKAGRSRWLGRRPRTRPAAMNPVDHPLGGGEGRSKGGQPKSRTGIYSQGQKTRNPKKATSKYIIARRKNKRGTN
jgi:large subunit ribosomal protein L2